MINYLVNVKQKNGSKIQQANTYEDVRRLAIGKEKVNLPALTVHSGVRGTYTPTNLFFIDIDIDTYTQEVIQNREEIFNRIPCIAAIQKSFSGKLHLICIHSLFDMIPTQEEWLEKTRISSIAVLHMLKSGFNIDFLNNIAFDFHNLNWTQLFFVSANPFYINEHANGVKISEKDANLLKITYQEFFEGVKEEKNKDSYIPPMDMSMYKITPTNEKITIDKTFTIGDFSGNDLRFRIGTALLHILRSKEKAQDFVKEHFTNYLEFSYYDRKPNRIVWNWLLDTYFQKEGVVVIPNDGYLSDYHGEILSTLEQYDKIQIKGTVGIGKSTEIITLAKELNAVLIVPYLSTNEIYDGEIEVLTSINDVEYDREKAQCMVFDQAVKYDFGGRVVIVDESHALYLERDFRESAIKLLPKLENVKKLILVSATPCDELNRLGGGKTITYTKKHLPVYVTPYFYSQSAEKLRSIENTIEEHLNGRSNWDIICIMDDTIAKTIYDVYNKTHANDILYFRSETKETPDCIEMFKEEYLKKKLVICTRVAFNGLNFRNQNQKILLINSLDCPQTIIQQAGRFRNTFITMRTYVNICEEEENTDRVHYMKDKYEYTQINNAEFLENHPLCEVPGFFDAYEELIKFYMKYDFTTVKNELMNEGYFKFNEPVYIRKIQGVKREEPNKIVSNYIKNDVIPSYDSLSVSEKKSFRDILRDIDSFCNTYNIEPLYKNSLDFDVFLGLKDDYSRNREWLLKLLNSYDIKRIIPSIIDDVKLFVFVSQKSEKDFNLQISLLENWVNNIKKNPKLKEKAKFEGSKLKKINNMRLKNYTGSAIDIMDRIIEDNEVSKAIATQKRKEENKEDKAKGGKKSSPKKKVQLTVKSTGEKMNFDSKTECMDFLQISSASFSKLVKGVKLKNKSKLGDYEIVIL